MSDYGFCPDHINDTGYQCPTCEINTLQSRIRDLEAERDSARQAGAEAGIRWAMEHIRGWHKGHWYGNEDETDSDYIQRGLRAVGGK